MERKYKEMLLLTGLDNLLEEEFRRFKFLVPEEFKIAKGKVEAANKIDLADLMIQNVGVVSAVTKTIRLLQKLNYNHVAHCLREEKEKVDKKYLENGKKKGRKQGKKESEAGTCPVAPAVSTEDATKPRAATKVSPQAKPQEEQTVTEQESIPEGLQKEPLTVVVLKAMKPLEFEAQEGKQEMFHATVATEKEFFFVKVFNTQLKDKFIPKRIIVISKYYCRSGFLEVDSSSAVFDAEADQKVSVPNHIIRKAGETPKINKLQRQPLGTIVNGLFLVQKKTEQKDGVSYEVVDHTGRMEVLVLGNQSKTNCEEGDKLRLTFFELSKSGEKLQLSAGAHSFFKVGITWERITRQGDDVLCFLSQEAEQMLLNRIQYGKPDICYTFISQS